MTTSIIRAGGTGVPGVQTTGGDDGALALKVGPLAATVEALNISSTGTGAFVGQVTATGFTGTLDGILGSGTPAAATVTTFTSNGIDDNADAVAITIDSSENVGIGTASPATYGKFTVNDTAAKSVYIRSTSTNFSGLLLENTNSATKWQIGVEGGAFNTAGKLNIGIDGVGSALMIDASRNVGIGTASPAELIHTSSASDAGIRLDKSGVVATRIKSVSTGLAFFADTSSGTAERVRITSAGNVGIGTTAPTDNLQVTGSGRQAIGISSTSGGAAVLEMFSSAAQAISYGNDLRFASISGLGDAGFSEKMRILAAGNLCVGVAGVRNSGMISLDYTSAGASGMGINDTNSGNGGVHIGFLTGGTFRGSITNNNNTAVAYNTTSDARLKENLVPISDAIGRVNKLNPVKFNWINNGSVSEGFIAQEILAGDDQLAEDMVTGNPDGDAETAPMQVDYAKITPLLTAALQEALAKIDSLEKRILKMEG